ncbi:MAG: peptide chain release factor N(5)-glutamine methyltransferase, partial [Bacteroidales bacterium]|nr:peptide chain release factor N(5)-glutamine methyltransferase [Bacteroidales bacterium]
SDPDMELPGEDASLCSAIPPRHSASGIQSALDALATGRPLQYVLGFAEFCGHRFKVGEGCLIPRPETEELVSRIIDDLSGMEIGEEPFNILDLCTGSGCIAWSLAAEFPEAMVYGCDLSDAALRYACRQRVRLRGASPIFFSADLLAEPPAGLPKFDVIVSNPPYICEGERTAMRPNVLDFEPAEALFVPDDDPLKFYRAITRWADAHLCPDGRIYLEINERFGPDVASLFPGSRVLPDISGRDRFIIR